MSKKDLGILQAEILLERKENQPNKNEPCMATVIAKNSRGLILDIKKTFEAYMPASESGSKEPADFEIGSKIEGIILGKSADGTFKFSLKQIEQTKNWEKLEALKSQDLKVKIHKVVKSGIEVLIAETDQIGFIPFRYVDNNCSELAGIDKESWAGIEINARVHELDKEKNKIILNNRAISDEIKAVQAQRIIGELEVGQTVSGKVVRSTDFGVFVDLGGLDALVPASELSWRRFKKASDVVEVGQEISAKVFRVDKENKKVGISIKAMSADPWTTLSEDYKIGKEVSGKVVTKADFGVFVEVVEGVEALLHKSNFANEEDMPDIGTELSATIINLDTEKKRMGIKPLGNEENNNTTDGDKELEHV